MLLKAFYFHRFSLQNCTFCKNKFNLKVRSLQFTTTTSVEFFSLLNCLNFGGAAIAQLLPSCLPGFESQAYHLSFYKFIIVSCGKDENKRKRGRDWPIFFYKKPQCQNLARLSLFPLTTTRSGKLLRRLKVMTSREVTKINWAEVIFVPDQGIILEFMFRFYLEVTKNIFIPNLST